MNLVLQVHLTAAWPARYQLGDSNKRFFLK
jgi:hypothetical protein